MKTSIKIMIGFVVFLIIYISTLSIILEGVDEKLKRTCALYGMDYHYHGGTNCIEKDGTIYPIATDCPEPYQRGTCEIKFIK